MRAANFSMGSVLPEHHLLNGAKLAPESFRPNPKSINAASQLIHSTNKCSGVSEGNPLMKGKNSDFVTNNMQQIRWIQPTPVGI